MVKKKSIKKKPIDTKEQDKAWKTTLRVLKAIERRAEWTAANPGKSTLSPEAPDFYA